MIALLYNFLTGAPLDGRRRTNATFLRRADSGYLGKGKPPSRWHYLSRAERLLIRWGCMAVTAYVGWSWTRDPEGTATWLVPSAWVTCVVGLTWSGWWAVDQLLGWRHRRQWVWPLHTALHRRLGYSEWTRPRHYLVVPPDFDKGGTDSIRVELPADFIGGDTNDDEPGGFGALASRGTQGQMVKQVLREKLPLDSKQFKWHLKGPEHWLEIQPVPQPPAKVLITNRDHRELVERLPEDELMVGLSALPLGATNRDVSTPELRAGGRPETVSLSAETPHMGVFARSGMGKSVLVSGLAAQVLRKGGQVVFIDIMAISHNWARGLPGVTYVSSVPDIHNALILLAAEGQRRNRIVLDWEDDDTDPDVGHRILIVFEEITATFRKLERYWKRVRESNDQKDSPAVEAYEDLIFMGRKAKQNLLLVGQSGTTRTMGGPEIRENLQGGLMIAGWSTNSWRMLVPGTAVPKPSRHTGRWQFVRSAVARETQVLFFSDPKYRRKDSELCKWALGGVQQGPSQFADLLAGFTEPLIGTSDAAIELPEAPPALPVTPSQVTGAPVGYDGGPVTVTGRHLQPVPPAAPEQPEDEIIGLREAWETGVIDAPSLAAARQARHRHRDTFPESKGKRGSEDLYSKNELAFWDRNRKRDEDENRPNKGETA